MVKNLPAMQENWVQSLGQEDFLEKGMAIHSSILSWKIPWTEERGRNLRPWGCKESDMSEQLHQRSDKSKKDGSYKMKSSWMVNHLCSHSFPLEITWRAIISHPHIGKIYVSNKVEGWNKPLQQQVTQLCPTLCNPMDSFPPASPVHGILQARILEWVAIPFSRGSSQPKGQTQVSHIAGKFFTVNLIL